MSRDYDPKELIIKQLEGVLGPRGWGVDSPLTGIDRMQPLAEKAGIRVFGPDYLLAVYDRAGQYTAGRLLVPDAYLEDKVQGKVSLVVGIGPLCAGPEYDAWFQGHAPQLGDWVVTSIRDGLTFLVGGVTMKLVEWKYLRMCTFEPDLVM